MALPEPLHAVALRNPAQVQPDTKNDAHAGACQQCGACCATYRVSFYWAEAERLPPALTLQISPTFACMTGTHSKPPRCIALSGSIGEKVACSVYATRPAPCHELMPGDDKCLRARAGHGLGPLPHLTAAHAAHRT